MQVRNGVGFIEGVGWKNKRFVTSMVKTSDVGAESKVI